jgi:CRP/FNR family transcriptional regulator, cyclic AMP receptor protein
LADLKIPKDRYLFREGDAPDAMYIVKSGSLAITKAKGSSEIVLAEIGPGSMVGEMALFDMKPRSANVKAAKDSEVISLPYESLQAQMTGLPVWVRAIMKTLNENLREANKKIKMLESAAPDQERFPPHVVNKLMSIFNFIGAQYGTKEGDVLLVPQFRLRNFTIQVFQEATNKMTSLLQALQGLGYVKIEDLGEGKQKISNLNPQFLFAFVDWYNDWLFKPEKDRIAPVEAHEVKALAALAHFAKKVEPDAKGLRKVNLGDIQNESMKELGDMVKMEEFNSIVEKKLVSEKIMAEGGVFVHADLSVVEPLAKYWKLVWDLKKILR